MLCTKYTYTYIHLKLNKVIVILGELGFDQAA